jgi:hypothetical protein
MNCSRTDEQHKGLKSNMESRREVYARYKQERRKLGRNTKSNIAERNPK